MSLFNQLYQIKGKHAEMLRKLTSKECLNCKNIDIFFISIAIGLWQNLKSDIDDTLHVEPAKIDPEQMVRYNDDIEYFYELIMLSDTRYCPLAKERANKAFRYKGKSEGAKDEKYFTQVMLGGLEYLYDSVAQNINSKEDIFNNLYDLVEAYDIENETTEDNFI